MFRRIALAQLVLPSDAVWGAGGAGRGPRGRSELRRMGRYLPRVTFANDTTVHTGVAFGHILSGILEQSELTINARCLLIRLATK